MSEQGAPVTTAAVVTDAEEEGGPEAARDEEEVAGEVVDGNGNGNGSRQSAGQAVIPAPRVVSVEPVATAADLVKRLDMIKEAMATAMEAGIDYGVIPGTSKPTLLKPGAEKLAVMFKLDVQPDNEKTWDTDGHLTVISRATVYDIVTGARVGFGEGICSSRERKYAYRRANRTCPECSAEAILLSREESEGFFCWRKRDGCGAKFDRNDQRLTSQEEGEIDNPDLADVWNTVDKMASKRARIDAVLAVTGASAIFTQDLEDKVGGGGNAPPPAVVEIDPESALRVRSAMAYLLGEAADSDAVAALWSTIERECDGAFPLAAGHAVFLAAAEVGRRAKAAAAGAPDPQTGGEVVAPQADVSPTSAPAGVNPATGEATPEAVARRQADVAKASGMVAESTGPEADPGTAPASPKKRQVLTEACEKSGYSAEALKQLSGFLYDEVHSDKLSEKQVDDMMMVLEFLGAIGTADPALKGSLTKLEQREDRPAAKATFLQRLEARANEVAAAAAELAGEDPDTGGGQE